MSLRKVIYIGEDSTVEQALRTFIKEHELEKKLEFLVAKEQITGINYLMDACEIDAVVIDQKYACDANHNFLKYMTKRSVKPCIFVVGDLKAICEGGITQEEMIRAGIIKVVSYDDATNHLEHLLEIAECVYRHYRANIVLYNPEKGVNEEQMNVFWEKIEAEYMLTKNLIGNLYAKEAVLLLAERKGNWSKMTKEIYPLIARKHSTTVAGVEKAIRTMIFISWAKYLENPKKRAFLFPGCKVNHYSDELSIDQIMDQCKPTNANFLKDIVEKLFAFVREESVEL